MPTSMATSLLGREGRAEASLQNAAREALLPTLPSANKAAGHFRAWLRPTVRRRLMVLLVFLASLVVAVAMFPYVHKQSQKPGQDSLNIDCANQAFALKNTFDLDRKTMRILASVVMQFGVRSSPPSLTPEIYKELAAETMAASLSLGSLTYGRYVRESERADYEAEHGRPIMDAVKQAVAAPSKDHLVVEYAYVPGAEEPPTGIDMMGYPGVRDGVRNFLAHGEYYASLSTSYGSVAMGLHSGEPLLDKDMSVNATYGERQSSLVGILGAQFQMSKIQTWVQEGEGNLLTKLVDITGGETTPLFVSQEETASKKTWTREDFDSHHPTDLGIAYRSFELWCRRRSAPRSAFLSPAVMWSLAVAVAGALLAHLMWHHVASTERTQQEYVNALKLADELSQARKEAQDHDSSHATFLASVFDEIRTPMDDVMGMLNLLLDSTELTTVQTDYVETALTSGRALESLVNDILEFSGASGASGVSGVSGVSDFSAVEARRTELERIAPNLVGAPNGRM